MSSAQVTYFLPTTRANGNTLPLSEIDHVDVYDNYGGETTEQRIDVKDSGKTAKHNAQSDGAAADLYPHKHNAGLNNPNKPNPVDQSQDQATQQGSTTPRKDREEARRDTRPVDERKAAGRRNKSHGKVGSTSDNEGEYIIENIKEGIHYISLVVVDTEGRASDPSAPFRLVVSPEGEVQPYKARDPSERTDVEQEPAQARAISGTGVSRDRPSMITKVSARLL